MTAFIPENLPTWLVDWTTVHMMPPRDPEDDDAEDEEDDIEPDDETEPAVIREPDE
jgi:hypothetical protein